MSEPTIVLVDLSSIAHPLWHISQNEPDPNWTKTQVVAKVRALATGHESVAICCDSGRSFRKDIAPTYKAQRPEHEATLHHQIDLAREQLVADGFPVWAAKGFEADDLIASATAQALQTEDLSVLVVSADKDLLQLTGPRVRVFSPASSKTYDEAAVMEKFGIRPDQFIDWLALVGDSSDNIKGADGIGPKKATELLQKYGTLEDALFDLAMHGTNFKPAMATSLREFESRMTETKALITLRTDVDIPFAEICRERVPVDLPTFDFEPEEEVNEIPEADSGAGIPNRQAEPRVDAAEGGVMDPPGNGAIVAPSASRLNEALAKVEPAEALPAPAQWELALEPRSMREAKTLAADLHASRLFSAYGNPPAVLATLMAGREFGMQAMASLRAFHVIEGKPTLAADALRALVIKSGAAKYFRCTERNGTRATFETQRGEDPPISLSYTIEEGRAAFSGDDKAWAKSGWGKNPADLCVARASSKLARLVYADVIAGLYASEEMD